MKVVQRKIFGVVILCLFQIVPIKFPHPRFPLFSVLLFSSILFFSHLNPFKKFRTQEESRKTFSHRSIPSPFKELLSAYPVNEDGDLNKEALLWWRTQLAMYLIRPNYQTRKVQHHKQRNTKKDKSRN